MKRSLNNRFKGKRLVEGNENEITAHELLLKEEDDKIVVKGRGSSGNVEVLSGGNSDGNNDNEVNVEYYIKGTDVGGTDVNFLCKKEPFTNLYNFYTQLNKDNVKAVYKTVIIAPDKNIQINKDGNTLYINVSNGATGISHYSDENCVLFAARYDHNYTQKFNGNCYLSIASLYGNRKYDLQSVYEASTNILYYYSDVSKEEESPINLTINPELAESLKIYEVNTYGGGNYKFRINGGSSIVTTENIANSIDK